ncbi:penicillin acylase family protein [Saxibacter everestensis]|uniref:Penicillin acylase family protein n=2 Tax=Saxibacter everestensis TaxID=2909229 RepID=A0ABY8QYF7_9MICO|nr:penicillin acylase family protein [Brevibacteriaceae bacterium ZFBP1038]
MTIATVVRSPLPSYTDDVTVPGLAKDVTIKRDELGIPQIYAEHSDDLFYAQGFVHAQDRFFEMDYRRHVTAGRLSELVGENPDALAADKLIRTLGWRRVAEKELPLLDKSTREYLQAYADGVNAYLAGKSPRQLGLAYTVLGMNNEIDSVARWSPVDSLAWLKAMAWDLKTNFNDELDRAGMLSTVKEPETVDSLFPAYPEDHPTIVTAKELAAGRGESVKGTVEESASAGGAAEADSHAWVEGLRAGNPAGAAHKALNAVPNLLGTGDGIGSNSWVVSGELTATGKPMLANDPHLGLAAPNIWYQAGLHCKSVGEACPFDVAGFGFSGLPGIFIGHNQKVGWGFTNLGADVTDFYLEEVDGDTYRRDGEDVPLETRTEEIRIAGAPSVKIEVRSTVHGPLISDAYDDAKTASRSVPNGQKDAAPAGEDDDEEAQQRRPYALSLSWTALTPGRTADAIFLLNTAENFDDVREAARSFEVPGQNIVFADTAGHIGYQTPGKIPVRNNVSDAPAPSDGSWPMPGWDSSYDWQGFVDFDELPSVLDPRDGVIVTANQPVIEPGAAEFLGADFDYGFRAKAIQQQISAAKKSGRKLTAADMNAIQNSSTNEFAKKLVPYLEDVYVDEFTREAVDLLRGWDYTQPADSAPAAYFNAVWKNLQRVTFDADLPEGMSADGSDRWMAAVMKLLDDPDNKWWDDSRTQNSVENRDLMLAEALTSARSELTASLGKNPEHWEWGMLHQLRLEQSPLGGEGVPALIRGAFNAKPVGIGGGTGLVNATSWDASKPGYDVESGPSMRMVLDFGNFDRSTWVSVTGNSAHPFSPNYLDQLSAWAAGETFPWPYSGKAVDNATQDEMRLLAERAG